MIRRFNLLSLSLVCGLVMIRAVAGRGDATSLTAIGRVVDVAGRPIAGAKVTLLQERDSSGTVVRTATSDSEGRFELNELQRATSVPGARYHELIAEAQGHAIGAFQYSAYAEFSYARIVLRKVAPVAGRVSNLAGGPIENARVIVTSCRVRDLGEESSFSRGSLSSLGAMTDSAGIFHFHSLPANAVIRLEARHPDYGGVTLDEIRTGTRDVRLTLVPPATLQGSVITDEGTGLKGLPMSAFSMDGISARTVTDETGGFRFTHLSAGRYTISARPDSKTGNYLIEYKSGILIRDGTETSDIVVRAVRGGIITGKFTDAITGEPVVGVEPSVTAISRFNAGFPHGIQLAAYRERSNHEGVYRTVALPGDSLVRHLYARGYQQTSSTRIVVIRGESVNVDLKLDPITSITGIVKDASDKPVEGAMVSYGRGISHRSLTDSMGSFVFYGWPAPSRLWALQPELGLAGYVESVAPGDSVTIRMGSIARVEGQVVDPIGRPIAGARIGLAVTNRIGAGTTTAVGDSDVVTDASGKYVLNHLWGGDSYSVYAHARGYAAAKSEQFTLALGEQKQLMELVLKAAAEFASGSIVNHLGMPIPGVMIIALSQVPQLPPGPSALTSSDGRFRVEGLSTDPVTLQFSHSEYQIATMRVNPFHNSASCNDCSSEMTC